LRVDLDRLTMRFRKYLRLRFSANPDSRDARDAAGDCAATVAKSKAGEAAVLAAVIVLLLAVECFRICIFGGKAPAERTANR